MKKKWLWITSVSLILIAVAIIIAVKWHAGSEAVPDFEGEVEDLSKHIHGVGYTADGSKIIFATHEGLKVYGNGKWLDWKGQKHDYVGFSPTDFGFYSSGYPAEGSGLGDPLGIVKSMDEGKTVTPIALNGEAEFEGMSASYKKHTLYVYNSEENASMKEPGLFYSQDEAKSWKKIDQLGLEEMVSSMAIHPSEDNMIAMGSDTGVYLSTDYGSHFEKVIENIGVTALAFASDGKLLVTGVEKKPIAFRWNPADKRKTTLTLPKLPVENPVVYMAQNPEKNSEIVIVTDQFHVYVTENDGTDWKNILETE